MEEAIPCDLIRETQIPVDVCYWRRTGSYQTSLHKQIIIITDHACLSKHWPIFQDYWKSVVVASSCAACGLSLIRDFNRVPAYNVVCGFHVG